MKVTRYFLWNDLITYVSNHTADINNILYSKIMRIGIYSDVKDTKDAGLRGTCNELLGEISELYDRVLEIKTQCAFIEEPKEEEDKDIIQQLEANNFAILEATFDSNLPKDMTVKEFKIKNKDLFDEHERLEKLLKEDK